MPVSIKVYMAGSEKVIAMFDKNIKAMRDIEPALKKGGNVMLRSVDENFKRGGRPVWRALSSAYFKRKVMQGYSPLPLTRTGQLRRSIVFSTTKTTLKVGTAVRYAKYHHFGTWSLPKRRFLLFQKIDIQRINRLVLEHMTGKRMNSLG